MRSARHLAAQARSLERRVMLNTTAPSSEGPRIGSVVRQRTDETILFDPAPTTSETAFQIGVCRQPRGDPMNFRVLLGRHVVHARPHAHATTAVITRSQSFLRRRCHSPFAVALHERLDVGVFKQPQSKSLPAPSYARGRTISLLSPCSCRRRVRHAAAGAQLKAKALSVPFTRARALIAAPRSMTVRQARRALAPALPHTFLTLGLTALAQPRRLLIIATSYADSPEFGFDAAARALWCRSDYLLNPSTRARLAAPTSLQALLLLGSASAQTRTRAWTMSPCPPQAPLLFTRIEHPLRCPASSAMTTASVSH
ncbi:hypothetical protein MSAN_02093800 [Mycena sanguinolenta]|uniref:Uncharacterized protein n=1 Tax=Mycena sanguinolenta TaxID=230812 RepID=A0A8H6XIF3_9AGAR|nr:hypothetical protein MSAN_02093800 [Mycena sanguinolenta]